MMTADISYHGVVLAFDLDDTLYSEYEYACGGFAAVASYLETCGLADASASADAMQKALRAGENPFEALGLPDNILRSHLEKMLHEYRTHKPCIHLRGCMADLLPAAASRGVVMAIITDGSSSRQRAKIKALGIEHYFKPGDILISEEQGCDKHETLMFRMLVDNYPEASHFIYVGDNPAKDFYWGNILGWTTVCLSDDGFNIHPQVFNGTLSDPQIKVTQENAASTIIDLIRKHASYGK